MQAMGEAMTAKRIGVISITPRIDQPDAMPFERLYEAVGKNTGNFMFTQAMFRNIEGEVAQIGFGFDPEAVNRDFDAVVVPAANWLNAGAKWDWFCDLIDRLEIPVVTIGIGLQAPSLSLDQVVVSDSAIRLARTLGRKGAFISTRGDFTRAWLQSIGVENAVTTGCPSLYMQILPDVAEGGGAGFVVQSTRYGITQAFAAESSTNARLFSYAATQGHDIVFQSEPEEIRALVYGAAAPPLGDYPARYLAQLYGLADAEAVLDYLRRKGHVFFDLEAWARFLQTRAGVLGTRLHGTILALNSGVPSVLFGHDSRTAELIDYAALPTADPEQVMAGSAQDLFDSEAYYDTQARYLETREANRVRYAAFLAANGLNYRR